MNGFVERTVSTAGALPVRRRFAGYRRYLGQEPLSAKTRGHQIALVSHSQKSFFTFPDLAVTFPKKSA
jgi:hypothetical protein